MTPGPASRTSYRPSTMAVARRPLTHPLQRFVVNPLVRLAFRAGLPDPGDALLETTGRRTGQPRVTPVCDGLLEDDTFWVVSEWGREADWVRNIERDPRVRVRVPRGPWRFGTAHVDEDDDPFARGDAIAASNLGRRLCVETSRRMATREPVSIRIDLDPPSS
jgi:deazaflavin-dependent oxidoreductase (nitroreductase family)